MDDDKYADIEFPLAGLDLSHAFGMPRPGTTRRGRNVRGFEVLKQRGRGGQRAGTTKWIQQQLPSGTHQVQLLNTVSYIGFPPPPTSTLLTGLIAYWKMDEATGASRLDSSGNSHTITDNLGTVAQAPGKLGNAANFAKTHGQYLVLTTVIGDVFHIGPGADLSITGWIKTNTHTANGWVLARSVLTAGGVQEDYHVYVDTSDHVFFEVFQDTTHSTAISANGSGDGIWDFFIAWYDHTTGKTSIQLNNGAINTSLTSIASVQDSPGTASHSTNLQIGDGPFTGALVGISAPFDGLIDSVGMWARILTPAERSLLYNGGVGLEYPWT